MSFYMKRSYVDTQPGIELVNIHYTWTPVGQQPNWEAHRETRAMPRGGVLVRGMGGTTLDETGNAIQTASQTVELPDDGTRRKVIRVPSDVWDPAQNKHVENYDLHHYFEVFREGKRELSPVYTEEIVSQEVEFVDQQGTLGGMCIYWSLYDWDAPQYQPTEVPRIHREIRRRQSVSFVQVLRLARHGRIRPHTGRDVKGVADATALRRQDSRAQGRTSCAELARWRHVGA